MDELSHLATDSERRDLVTIGASVEFAASFGAPVGGLLFILDDISSYFERRLMLRMLVANAIGTFCLAVKHGDLSNYLQHHLHGHLQHSQRQPLYKSAGRDPAVRSDRNWRGRAGRTVQRGIYLVAPECDQHVPARRAGPCKV
mmetsp:Transcript_2714/g.6793  ORF Transcript_2714/g.6793 Transcript_2714/m.6793 type:complete len:143 (-) Transcript_2714:858-1286(-)